MDYRKLILIIGFAVLTTLLGFGVYWVFFVWEPTPQGEDANAPGAGGILPGIGEGFNAPRGGGEDTLPGGADRPGSQLPTEQEPSPGQEISDVANGGLTSALPISGDRVQDPALSRGGQGLAYYNPDEGKFYRLTADGSQKTLMSEETFYAVDEVTWSSDQSKAVLEYPDGSNIVYNFGTKQQVTLPRQAQDFAFSPDSNEVVYEYIGGADESNWLTLSKANGTGAEFVQALGDRADQVQVSWSPSQSVVALFRKSAGLNQEEIIFLGLNQENYKSIVVRGTKFEGIWSPRGDRIVYHTVRPDTDYRPTLWTVQAIGDTIGKNHFPLFVETWVDKCVFTSDGRALYCAVSQSLPRGAGLDRSIVDPGVPDDIYYVDLATGQSTLLARPVNEFGTGFQVGKIFVNAANDTLFLWDDRVSTVYSVKLK